MQNAHITGARSHGAGGGPLQPNSFWGKWEYNVWMCQLVNTEGARGRPTVRAGHAHLARKSHYCQKWMGSDNNLVKHNRSNHTNHIETILLKMKSAFMSLFEICIK